MTKIAPSILSADFSKLGDEVKALSEAGADYIHIDVMDGHFVPNITLGAGIVKSIKQHSEKVFDCHLMISEPEKYIDAFADAGADIITVHQESSNHLHRLIQNIKARGLKAGVSINPATPASSLKYIIDDIDMVLVMSVNPGFGGQKFIENSLEKIQELRKMSPTVDIQVDGGVNEITAKKCVASGANVLVAGSYVFKGNYKEQINKLKNA